MPVLANMVGSVLNIYLHKQMLNILLFLLVFFVSMQSPTASTYAVQEIPSIPPAQMPGDWVWARACKANSVTG